jgi:membrane-associated phospholipid phosphatase
VAVLPTAGRRDHRTTGIALRLTTLGACALVAMAAVYLLSAQTTRGQRIENALLEARSSQLRGGPTTAAEILATVSVWSLVATIAGVVLIAVLRGRARLALGAGAVIGLSVVTTELLKHVILPRPALDPGAAPWHTGNIFPSGHTTIAVATAVALVLVVPDRLRSAAAFAGGLYAALVAGATLEAGWHRTSDALGAILLVLGLALGACAALVWWRGPGRAPPRRRTIGLVTLVAAGTLAAAVGLAGAPRILDAVDRANLTGSRVQQAYAVTLTLVALAVAVAMALLLAALHDVSLDDQPEVERRAAAGSPR